MQRKLSYRTHRIDRALEGVVAAALGACLLLEVPHVNFLSTIRSWIKAAGDPSYYRDFNRVPLASDAKPDTIKNPYRQSVWVQSAINTVTQPLKSVSLKFYKGDTEIAPGDLTAFWRRPAKGLSYEEWIDATAGWFKLRGEFFWVLGDEWLVRSARKGQILVVRPDAMREITQAGELIGWEMRDAYGARHALLPEQVIHIKRWNPASEWRGLGELDAALMATETDYLAGKYARDTFANMGDHGDYVVAKGGIPDDAQRQQITMALREKRAAKLRGDFKPVFLTGDIDVKSPSLTSPDAAFVANRVQNRHEIYAAFGVPMSMADVAASYSIGSASDYFRLIFGTCQPLGATIAGAVEAVTAKLTGGESLEAEFDWDEHPVMQTVRAERIDSASKLFSLGVPMAQVNDYLDMGLKPFPGWDVAYLPFSLAPVGTATDPATDPNLGEVQPADPAAAMLRVLGKAAEPTPAPESKADPRRVALWKTHMVARRGTEKQFESKFSKVMMAARAETLRKLNERGPTLLSAKAVAEDFLFDFEDFEQGLVVGLRDVSRSAMTSAGQALFAEVAKDDPFSMPPARALQFLKDRENLIKDVAADVFADIKTAITESITAGESIATMRDRIRAAFNDATKARATRIAMTETAAAYGTARDEAMKQAGVQFKEWLTSGNENVRDSHRAAEGQTVALDQPFDVGGHALMFPGDPSGPPEEIINCHCVQIAVAAPKEDAQA